MNRAPQEEAWDGTTVVKGGMPVSAHDLVAMKPPPLADESLWWTPFCKPRARDARRWFIDIRQDAMTNTCTKSRHATPLRCSIWGAEAAVARASATRLVRPFQASPANPGRIMLFC